MIEIVATWLLAVIVIFGLGLPVGCRLTHHGPTALRIALWSGAFTATMVVALANLVTPLRSVTVGVAAISLAALGAAVSWQRVRSLHWPQTLVSRWWTWTVVTLGLVGAVGWAIASQRAPSNYDTGLYHLGAIEYAAQAATVPGLANLYGPLGYGNVMVPTAAALTNGPSGIDGFAAVNSLFLLLLVIDLLLRLRGRTLTVGGRITMVAILMVYPPMLWMADAWVTSPTSDTAVLALTIVGVASLADIVWRGRCTPGSVILVLAPLSIAGAMRPQAWVMVGASALVLCVVSWRPHRSLRDVGTTVGHAILLPVVAILVGLVRDAVLSGWWLYPFDRFPLPVSWRAEDPGSLLDLTIGIARDPGPGYQQAVEGFGWLPGWLARLPDSWEFWLLAVIGITGFLLLVTSRTPVRWRALALTLVPGLFASVLWVLVSPPTFRFGWGPLISTTAVLLAWAWMSHTWATAPIIGLGFGAVLTATVAVIGVRAPAWPADIPSPETRSVPGDLGLVAPVGTDQCWSVFPLCSPDPAEGLALRGAEWREGFWRGNQAG